ncbi:TIGR02206 family membrane protein [Flavobacteriaceae bacterium]|nr:TIGR02206 family membrane protein [Flavobacteriaceae bacterium]
MNDFFFGENADFVPFSGQHILISAIVIVFGTILIFWAKKQSEQIQFLTGNIIASSISLTVIFGSILNSYKPDFNYQEDLPLHLCSFLALVIPVLSYTRKYIYYEIFFFLILAGTLQSLITPSDYNFLNFTFFRYWFVHSGLVLFMLYATFVYKMRPTIKSVFKSFIGMQFYVIFMFLINYLLGSNYFYTNRKPDATTLLDVFGEWPQYIFVVELIVIPFFLLIYFPFYLTRKKE